MIYATHFVYYLAHTKPVTLFGYLLNISIHPGLLVQAISYPCNSWQDGERIGILQRPLLSHCGMPGWCPCPDLAL